MLPGNVLGMVPGEAGRPTPRWCLVRARRQCSSGPLLPGNAHTRGLNEATPFAHKGGIKPLCAVLCCVIPSLVCATGTCAPKKNTPVPPCSSDREPETLGPGPASADTVSAGAPCAATIQGCRGALAAPVGCCTGGGRGCPSH